ncbi:MAG: META domain-containing protein [Acidimicrobiia bacterium]|nr:META domain-containing protein [Acidimicrobiia bacterium]
MEPLRTATSPGVRGSGGRPSRWSALAAAVVVLVTVVGLTAWLNRDDGQSIDTDVADGTTEDGGAQRPLDVDSLVGTTWVLRAGGGPGGDIAFVDGYPITLTFEADSFGGTAACNGYGSTYSVDGNEITIEGISATEMGCEAAVQAAEQAYFAALADVGDITLAGDELILGGPSTELIFTRRQPAPTEDLVDTLWLLDTIIRGDTAATVLGDPATLSMSSDGTFSGSTGCRTFAGRYQTFGSEVQFNEFAAGPEECPTVLRDQDNHVFSVLGDGFTTEIDGQRLTVTSAGGEGLGYRAG